MKGTVSPDQKACTKCKGKWINQKFGKRQIFVCGSCGEEPTLFKIRRYLPVIGKTDIRYDQNYKRLKDISAAYAMMSYIDGEIQAGTFDHRAYAKKGEENVFLFENFVKKTYTPIYEKKLQRGEIQSSTMTAKLQFINNHLLPFFTGKKLEKVRKGGSFEIKEVEVEWASKIRSLKHITAGTIKEFYNNSPASLRMRDLIAAELKVILGEARALELIPSVPPFPKQAKASLKDPEKFLTSEQQKIVLSRVEDQRYKAMLSIMCLIAIRPSEARVLKWSDWDFKNQRLWIRRHVSEKNIVADGRKSNKGVHFIALSKELLSIIQDLPRPINRDEYMFPGDQNPFPSVHCLSRAWNRAIKGTGFPHIDSYRGSKSSCMSNWLRKGYTISQIAAFTGLTEEDVRRYAQHNNQSVHDTQLMMMEG